MYSLACNNYYQLRFWEYLSMKFVCNGLAPGSLCCEECALCILPYGRSVPDDRYQGYNTVFTLLSSLVSSRELNQYCKLQLGSQKCHRELNIKSNATWTTTFSFLVKHPKEEVRLYCKYTIIIIVKVLFSCCFLF